MSWSWLERASWVAPIVAMVIATPAAVISVLNWRRRRKVAAGPTAVPHHRNEALAALRRSGAVLVLRAEELDARRLGVHPAIPVERGHSEHPEMPAYVPRTVDADLDDKLAGGGLVVIEGDSAAGKTRTALEAVRRASWCEQVIVPADGAALRKFAETGVPLAGIIIWLDDLNLYLNRGGLDVGLVSALCSAGSTVAVVGTLRSQARDALLGARDVADGAFGRDARRVLGLAMTVRLARQLDDTEQQGAQPFRYDPRVSAALDRAGEAGFAEYLAAGLAAVEHWLAGRDGAHPVGAALVYAAVDITRAGYLGPVPRDWLVAAYPHYLEQRVSNRRPEPDLDEAFAWATREVSGASSCLLPEADGRYRAFDYLVDHAQAHAEFGLVPRALWQTLLSLIPDDEPDLHTLAARAFYEDRFTEAIEACRRAAGTGHVGAMVSLAGLLPARDALDEAIMWAERAAELGHTRGFLLLGGALFDRHQPAAGEHWLRRAVVAGDEDAMHVLGGELRASKPDEAQTLLCQVAESGDVGAMADLVAFLLKRGSVDAAEPWLKRITASNDPSAAAIVAQAWARCGDYLAARKWWQLAVDGGDADAMYSLGRHHEVAGRQAKATTWLCRAAEAGHVPAMNDLAALYEKAGRTSEAGTWFRRAARSHHPDAMYNLGVHLHRTGAASEGDAWLRLAVCMLDVPAIGQVVAFMAWRNRAADAERWVRQAAEEGYETAMLAMGDVERDNHNYLEAERWYQQAANNGRADGMARMGKLYLRRNQVRQAREWLERGASAGNQQARKDLEHLGWR